MENKIIDISMNWESALKILLTVLEHGNEVGKIQAKLELFSMAKVADLAASKSKVSYIPKPKLGANGTRNFLDSLKNHQIKLHHGFAQQVKLLESDNEYFQYPVQGVLVAFEQGTDLSIIQAVFHALNADGSLGAPALVRSPKFESTTF